jgi:ABC-2 type transport system ATP-binding protein
MEEAAYLCDEIVIMDKGNILAKGPLEKLLNEHNIGEIIEFSFRESPSRFEFKYDNSIRMLFWDAQSRKGRLVVDEIIHVVPHFMKYIHENEFHLTSFECRKMTLEDLFISLTGRELDE